MTKTKILIADGDPGSMELMPDRFNKMGLGADRAEDGRTAER